MSRSGHFERAGVVVLLSLMFAGQSAAQNCVGLDCQPPVEGAKKCSGQDCALEQGDPVLECEGVNCLPPQDNPVEACKGAGCTPEPAPTEPDPQDQLQEKQAD